MFNDGYATKFTVSIYEIIIFKGVLVFKKKDFEAKIDIKEDVIKKISEKNK